ncbi:TonB-dependent receptor [Ralstonia solanacearum]|nr:TonB-dependent receptor [Ralstonia solanacearum]
MGVSTLRGLLLAGSTLGAVGAAGAQDSATAAELADVAQLAPVVVTGTKLDASGQTADSATSVASGARLRAAGVARTDELGKLFPELTVTPRSSRAYTLFGMRGTPSSDFYSPAVTVYVDGVPQDMAYFTQPLPDVEQVEVLRGPQGTLYGRAAQGGVINIVTKKPNNRFGAQASVDVNNLTRRTDLSVRGPLVKDLLYGDVSAYFDDRPGTLKNPATGADQLDSGREALGRARLRWTPRDTDLDATLSVSHDRYRSHEEYFQAYDLKDRHAIASSPFDLTEPSLTRTVTQAALSVDYYLRGWKLSSVSAYQDRRLERVLTTGNTDPENQKTFSQELRVATSGDVKRPVDGVFGLYYEKQAFERDRGIAVPGVSAFLFPGPSRSESNLRSMAAFGEGVWHATERLDLTAGLRYGIDSADIHYNRTGAAALSFAGDKTFRSLTPKVSVGYQAAPGWRVYGLYSEGYKAGGFNRIADNSAGSIPYSAERLRNVEVGFQADLLGKRLRLDGALFHSRTSNLQAQVVSGLFQMLSNVGDARATGVELNGTWLATPDLTLRAGGAWTTSKIYSYSAPQGNLDLTGKRVPYVVPLSLRASGEYRFRPQGMQGRLRWNVGMTYSGDMWFDAANTLRQPAYALLDTSLSWDINKHLTVVGYVDNLTDRAVRTYAFSLGTFGTFAQYGQGRTIGLRLQARL